jgi:LPS-assembly protein
VADAPLPEPVRTPVEPDLERLDTGLSWDYCGPPPPDLGPLRLPPQPEPGAPITLSADGADLFPEQQRALLQGNVVVDRGNQHLEADRASYDRNAGTLRAQGRALFQQPGLRVLGTQAEWDLEQQRGSIDQVHYRLTGVNARGNAARAELESPGLAHFRNITYTACPRGSEAWSLEARTLDVDQGRNLATARHAKLRVNGVPILYSPYISFPLTAERKSGFLVPSVGNSNQLGFDLRTPYYLNLAPNMDATLTPRYMSKRGIMLGGEFRYLTPHENGIFQGEVIPDDRDFEDGGTRGGFSFNQQGRYGPNWATNVKFNLVSDDTYLEDFGQNLEVTSTRFLERRGDLAYYGRGWYALGRLQGFQTVDPDIAATDQPYDRLPQLLFGARLPSLWGRVYSGIDAENVYFNHSAKVHGNRLAFRPWLSLPLRRSYGHLIPKATLHHASYWLTDQAAGLPDQPNSTVPTLSLDGGLIFERRLGWLGHTATQTLEPRLFYLYAPYRDQDDLPVFDTAEFDFSFTSLFRENRFVGRDRVGDANQLSLALTSRTLHDNDGRELFRASLGQILYFADRRVQLQGEPEQDGNSIVAGEVAARLAEDWSTRASIFWDPNRGEEQTRKASFGIHYRSPEQRLVNLTYRLNRSDRDDDTDFEDTDLSFRWPVNPNLELVGRWLYSLRYDQTLEAFAGIEYGRCCWRTRLLVRNFVINPDDDPNLSIMLQVELAGLGAFGNDIEDFLERGVYGYEVE